MRAPHDPALTFVHCVACGEQNIPKDEAWKRYRCLKCWLRFKEKGGIKRKDEVIVHASGMKTSITTFENQAIFCRDCGSKLDQGSQRVKYALSCGSECHTCDKCWVLHRFPPQ